MHNNEVAVYNLYKILRNKQTKLTAIISQVIMLFTGWQAMVVGQLLTTLGDDQCHYHPIIKAQVQKLSKL